MPAITQIKPSQLAAGESRHIQGIASKVDDLKLRGESFIAKVTDQVIDEGVAINRTIDGASTLEIPLLDDDGSLRRHPLFQERFTVEVDGLKFTYVARERTPDGRFIVTCEAHNVWRLRQHRGDDRGGPAKAFREKVTRAEFWVDLVKMLRPEIPVWCPELHTPQPIEDDRAARVREPERKRRRGRGLDRGAKLTVKGRPADAEQIRNGDTILRVGESLDAPKLAMVAAICAAIGESEIRSSAVNPSSGATGVFQLLAFWHDQLDPRDVAATAKRFYLQGYYHHGGAIELAKRGLSPGTIASMVEGSDAGGAFYDKYAGEAREWVEAFGGGSLGAERTITETKRYPFTIAAREDWWAGGQRLFGEVNWRLFEAAELIYVIAEPDLLDGEVRMRVREGAPGIDSISWTADTGQKVDEITIVGRARDWAAPPGAVAAVEGEGESIDGNYLVANIESLLATEDVTVTLKRPTRPLPEPAPETTTRTIGGGGGGGSSVDVGNAPEALQKMVAEAERIDKLNLTYVFGGGHVAGMAPANGPFDCSSAVSRVLQVGGFLDTTLTTDGLNSWGSPGKGKLVTVYVRNGGAGGGHTIMKLGDRFWGTSGENPGGGPGFFSPSSAYLATLPVHRHPKGL